MDIFMKQASEWPELVAKAVYLIGQVQWVEIAFFYFNIVYFLLICF